MTATLELNNISKAYNRTAIVEDLSLTVEKGQFVSLLGPSGCGKTTTLRMIAGFVEPTSGRIMIGGRDMTEMPPHKRDTGMVFQAYALFPHLTVEQNIAFGLKRRRLPKADISRRVGQMIELLQLSGLSKRLPRQLSGGQQQRVAVGRALVIEPSVLLLDEPFSNLDAKLRESTRLELRRLQQKLKLTTIFVTHDQTEAMAVSDHIAVMNSGRLEQFGTAREIYERPKTKFVTDFIGAVNSFPARIVATGGGLADLAVDGILRMSTKLDMGVGASVVACVRPEHIRFAPQVDAPLPENALDGSLEIISYQGPRTSLAVRAGNDQVVSVECESRLASGLQVGQRLRLSWDGEAVSVFPA